MRRSGRRGWTTLAELTDRRLAKKALLPDTPDFQDSFIVFNGNRNQPRKRIDITMKGFARFANGKPNNVKLYLHMGVEDAGCSRWPGASGSRIA